MTILEKCNKIEVLKNIKKNDMIKIMEHGFITGSHFFDVKTDHSDIDIVIKQNNFIDFESAINVFGCVYLHGDLGGEYSTDEFRSCYGLYNDKLINFLFMHNIEYYDKWKYATNKMKNLILNSPYEFSKIKDKEYRVELFEKFKSEYKK